MIAADRAVRRPSTARLLVVDAGQRLRHAPRARWLDFLYRGDLVVANDAATLPASLAGTHIRTGRPIELRLAAWRSPIFVAPVEFDALALGAGDYRTSTEDRPPPPALLPGDRLEFGSLAATIRHTLGHRRLVRVRFDMALADFWRGLAQHGRAIQYAHLREPLALCDAWTSIAAMPVAFEPPSAGFILDWQDLATLATRSIRFATLTHAAGLSSTGDADLDHRLPLDEWYGIPEATARSIRQACASGTRVIAIGTTVVRALEHAASRPGGMHGGEGIATIRIDASTTLRVIDAVVTGTHQPGSSHHELLRAFASDAVLARAVLELDERNYRTHEFGDSMLVFRDARGRKDGRREAAAA
jgi:S-adenosylmethionine:tRNA ribosyltransferase-isomerase